MDKALIISLVFYGFAVLLIASALMVILTRHPVRAALFLVLSFVFTAPLWLLLHAEFLALVLIFVYVGAVMTLFLFVVMMLDLVAVPRLEGLTRYFFVSAALVIAIVVFLIHALYDGGLRTPTPPLLGWMDNASNVKALGSILYTDYVFPFELSSVILLVAIIAAIALTFRGASNRKVQHIDKQVEVQKSDRLRIIKMEGKRP